MQKIILILMLLPMNVVAQKQDVYLKLTDAAGMQIKGDAVTRGFERSIYILSFSSGGKNNSQLSFNMNVIGASADLKSAMSAGMLLQNGILTVTQSGMGGATMLYTIKMEAIKVNACTEAMGCNAEINSTVVVTAARMGWTYYQQDGTGKLIVSRKYGYDNESGKEWTNF